VEGHISGLDPLGLHQIIKSRSLNLAHLNISHPLDILLPIGVPQLIWMRV